MRKMRKLLSAISLSLCMFFSVVLGACKSNAQSSYELNYDNYRLEIFQSFTLKVEGYDGELSDWGSSNPDVLSVENGVVTALQEGSAVISVVVEGKTLKCNVTVKPTSDVPMLVFDGIEEISALVGDEYELKTHVLYKGVKYDDFTATYVVDDSAIATANGNVFEMKSVGETTVYVSADWRSYKNSDLLKTALPLKVNEDVLAKIVQKQANVYTVASDLVKFGETYSNKTQLSAVVLKDGSPVASDKIVWNSSDENIATVNDQGVVTAVSNGTALVTVSYVDGNSVCTSNPITVTVSKPVIDGTRFNPILIDCFVGNQLIAAEDDKITYDFSSLISEGYAVTGIKDVATGEEIVYNTQTKTFGDLTIGENQWLIQNEIYDVKMNVICATKVITTAQEFIDLQKYGNVTTATYSVYYNGDHTVVAHNYSGYFVLGNDIKFTSSDFGAEKCVEMKYSGAGYNGKQFKELTQMGLSGTFNGLGYKLENLVVGMGGAFGDISSNGTVKNLNIVNAKFKVTTWKTTGIVANTLTGTLDNVKIDVDFDQISYASNKVHSGAVAYHLHDARLNDVYISVRDVSEGHTTIAYWVTGDSNKVKNVVISNTTNPYVGVKEGNAIDAFSQVRGVGETNDTDNDVSVDDGKWN